MTIHNLPTYTTIYTHFVCVRGADGEVYCYCGAKNPAFAARVAAEIDGFVVPNDDFHILCPQ